MLMGSLGKVVWVQLKVNAGLKIWVPYSGIHIVQFFSLQIDIFKRQMAGSYFLFGTGKCNEQCNVSELCVNF